MTLLLLIFGIPLALFLIAAFFSAITANLPFLAPYDDKDGYNIASQDNALMKDIMETLPNDDRKSQKTRDSYHYDRLIKAEQSLSRQRETYAEEPTMPDANHETMSLNQLMDKHRD